MLPLSTYQLYFDLGAFWVIHDVFQEPPQTLSTMLGSYAEEAPNFESLQFNQPSMQRCLGAGYIRDRHDTSAWNQNGLSSQGSWMWCHTSNQNHFFQFPFLPTCDIQFQLMKIIIQFVRRVLIPDSLPGSAASHFSTSQSTDSFRSQNTCSCSHGKSCISSIRSEGTAMCSAPVLRGKLWENGKVQKGVESEKKTLQGSVEFVKATSFQTQKTQKLDIKIDIQNIFHLQRLVSFLWRGKHHRWNCWRRVRVGETPRYTVFYICRPRSGRAEGEVAELTVQFCCKQISKSQCMMLYDALCIMQCSGEYQNLAKFW